VSSPDETDLRLLAAIADGLPLVPQPYAAVGAMLDLAEAEVITRLQRLCAEGIIRRFGVIVRHHELGFRANAMVGWDVPDGHADELGRRLAGHDCVTLCYRRRRAAPAWPYNLFCMIHGRDRDRVERQIADVTEDSGLLGYPRAVLFSRRRFKQRGARYHHAGVTGELRR